MTALSFLTDLSARGVVVTVVGDSIELDAPVEVLTDADIASVRKSKPELLGFLRLAEGLPVDDDAALLLDCDEIDPADVPVCNSCGGVFDVQTLGDAWLCSTCDPKVAMRRLKTQRLIRQAESIRRYTTGRLG